MEADKAMSGDSMMTESKTDSMQHDAMIGDAMEHDAMMGTSFITYKEYSESMSKYDGSKVVLFFAGEDATSTAIEKEFTDDMAKVPEGYTVVRVKHTAHMDVAQQYAVTTTPTFVELDNTGKAKASWQPKTAADLVMDAMSN